MFARLRRRLGLSPIAFGLVLAIGVAGSAGAAAKLITGKQIKDNSLTGKDVKDGSLLAKDFAKGQLPAGATGPAGPAGPAGPKGDPSYAVTTIVSPAADGAASGARLKAAVDAAAASGKRSLVWLEPGDYEVSGTLDLGAEVSLAGIDINATQVTVTPAGSNCGVIAPSTYGVIRDVELSVVGACGIQMAGPDDSLRIHDARITADPGSATVSATIHLAGADQSLRVDDSEIINGGTGNGTTVILGSASRPRVRITDSELSMSSATGQAAAVALSGASGVLSATRSLLTASTIVVGLGATSSIVSRDSNFVSETAAVIKTTSTAASTGMLYGGSIESPDTFVVVQPNSSAVRCIGVLDVNGASGTVTTGSCP